MEVQGPEVREGLLCTAQDRLPGGISREGSMTGRHELGRGYPNLSAAVRDNWLPSEGLASHPLDEHVADSHMDEPLLADIEDEYEGVCAANASSDEYSDVGEDVGGADTEVVFVKEGVCVFPTASRHQRILGRLSLIKQYNCLFICWLPYAAGAVQLEDASGAGQRGDAGGGNGAVESAKDRTMYAVHPIPLSDVRAIHKHTPPLGQHRITLTLATGVSLPSLHFQNGGIKSFLSCLREHGPLVRSADDPNTYLINDTTDPLQRSLFSLELTDVLVGRPPAGASSTYSPFAGPLAAEGDMSLRAQLSELVDRFQQLTQNARDTASSLFSGSMLMGAGGPMAEPHLTAAASTAAAAAATAAAASSTPATAAAPAGPAPDPDSPPLSLAELHTFFDADGRMTNFSEFKQRVHDGGVEAEARPEAWKLLLGLHAPGSTRAERQEEVEQRRAAFQRLRSQWRTMLPGQEAKCSKWRERRTRIDKDVRRTDRGLRFFAREKSQAHNMLREMLLTYERYNQDLGYVQGQSDLAAPCLYVMRSAVAESGQLANADALGVEAEAFWCFASLMERMEANFCSDSRAMHAQLLALRSLVQLLDPPLYAHLEAHDCLNFFFCYRWLLLHFKREFGFEEVLRLWEAIWSGVPGLHLYLCVAVLEHHRRTILSENWDFDGMLKFCVELSGRLRLEPLLRDADLLASYAAGAGRDIVATAMAGAAAAD